MGLRVTKYKDRFGFGFLGDEANAAQLAAAVEANNGEVIPRHLATLAKHVEAGGTGWLAGTAGPTIADFAWVPVLAAIADGWTGDAAALDATPALVALKDKFYALPEIKAYYDAKAAAQVGETKADANLNLPPRGGSGTRFEMRTNRVHLFSSAVVREPGVHCSSAMLHRGARAPLCTTAIPRECSQGAGDPERRDKLKRKLEAMSGTFTVSDAAKLDKYPWPS
ncbi:hypothetical protein AURANDRAFT_60815 [Aureococcus anophagefferens]|uniref:GST C-terminal domain-containing protein n=1 Tax=Aureococcus anophagefferens TaxID=44056 RepID=F0XWF3_AURAN|nr:hypothetical protein AURANDRAFT_60815 [Aureococcus anophagefferens]EGB12761.1 hypothetical protein AURANDRAFT_60815 [Aureococcus anophagefferens]|eukprot:XP_009032406.1 hypothetical protein AURANDRAFT_60815 [Aureococcus anophagefferens]